MARTVRDANLETRTARSRLPTRGKPHYRILEPWAAPRVSQAEDGAREVGSAALPGQ